MPSERDERWTIKNPRELNAWAFSTDATVEEGVAVLEFVRDLVLKNPDFGEEIDEHTRAEVAPRTTREVVWTFDPSLPWVRIIAPVDLT